MGDEEGLDGGPGELCILVYIISHKLLEPVPPVIEMTSHCGKRILRIDRDKARKAFFIGLPLPHTSEEGRRIIGGNPRRNCFEGNDFRENLTQVTARKGAAKLQCVASKRLTDENRARKRPAAIGNTVVRGQSESMQVVAGEYVAARHAGSASFAGPERYAAKPPI